LIKKLEEISRKEFNITALVAEVKEATDRLGINIVKNVLENLDETIKKDEKRKKEWIVERKNKKSIVTMLGMIEYKRTYYKSKKTGEYRYLLDEIVGISKHEKVDKCIW
jgi:transposase